MSIVELSVQKYFLGAPSGPGGALVSVIPIADADGKPLDPAARRALRRENLIVPIGSQGDSLKIDLPPGHYLARATLPFGEALEEEFEVRESKTSRVLLAAENSPHEWLSWHHFGGSTTAVPSDVGLKRVPPASQVRSSDTVRWVPEAGTLQRKGVARGVRVPGGAQHGFVGFAVGPGAQGAFGQGKLWDALLRADPPDGGGWSLGNPQGPDCWGERVLRADDEDQEFILFRSSERDGRWGGRTGVAWRNFFVARSADAVEVATVPLQWQREADTPPWSVEVLLRKSAPADNFLTRTTIVDSRAGALIGYMSQGRLDLARPFVDLAYELLHDKIFNPLGAAAGGYVLLSTAAAQDKHDWLQWTRNLMQWFGWLADGAVLVGINALRTGRNDEDFRAARDALLEGFNRGVPYFSIGVLLLQEGLLQLANEWHEPQTVQALAVVSRFAAHVDVSQPFTTLRFQRQA